MGFIAFIAVSVYYSHCHSTLIESFTQYLNFARSSMAQPLFKFFVFCFVFVEPISLIPLFAGLTEGATVAYQKHMAGKAAVIALGIRILFAIAGAKILEVMAISLSSFRIAGGSAQARGHFGFSSCVSLHR